MIRDIVVHKESMYSLEDLAHWLDDDILKDSVHLGSDQDYWDSIVSQYPDDADAAAACATCLDGPLSVEIGVSEGIQARVHRHRRIGRRFRWQVVLYDQDSGEKIEGPSYSKCSPAVEYAKKCVSS